MHIDDITCTTETFQECPSCKKTTRLDTEAGLERALVKGHIPYIECECGEVYKIQIAAN